MTFTAHGFLEVDAYPPNPDTGQLIYHRGSDAWYRYNGSSWVLSGSSPFNNSAPILPADHGLLGWSGDLKDWTGSLVLTSGDLTFARARVATAGAIGHVVYATSAAGSGLTYAKIGVYDLTGVLLGSTADLSATLNAASYASGRSEALTAPTSTLDAGTEVLVAVLAVGTTGPAFRTAAASATVNYGITAGGGFRAGHLTAQAALPSSLTPSATFTTNSLLGLALAA